MTLNERLAQIEEASHMPGGLPMRTVKQITKGRPDLLRALECASIPHAWDIDLLGKMIDDDLRLAVSALGKEIIRLPVVEKYISKHGYYNVHEVTRRVLREKIHAEGRLSALSIRAFAAYEAFTDKSPAHAIEKIYHQLLASPEEGVKALESQWRSWVDSGRWAELLDLAAMLEELLPQLETNALNYVLNLKAILQRGHGQSLTLMGDLAVEQGNLADAQRCYSESKVIAGRLIATDPNNLTYQKILSKSLEKLGDVVVSQGDLAKAHLYYNECRKIVKRLALADPDNAPWQRDLLVSSIKLGDVALAKGNIVRAGRIYAEGRSIVKRLVLIDSNNATWQKDLLVPHIKLGDTALAQGELGKAHRIYGEAKKIAESMEASHRGDAAWRFDVGIAHERLGDVAMARGDINEACNFYTKRKNAVESLVEVAPANAVWQRDLSVALGKLGNVALARGRFASAKKLYSKSKAISKRLAATDPANAGWQRDLSVSYEKMGDLAFVQRRLAAAKKNYCESMRISRRLAKRDPSNGQWQSDLAVSLIKEGNIAMAMGDLINARSYYDECRSIRARLTSIDARNAAFRYDLAIAFERLGDLDAIQGDIKGAKRYYNKSKLARVQLAESGVGYARWRNDLSLFLGKLNRLSADAVGFLQGEFNDGEGKIILGRLTANDLPTLDRNELGETSTILVVDDEDSVRQVINYVLTCQGHNVLSAADANEAWSVWREHSSRIRLAILDIKLPGGVSGFDLERALSNEDPSLPVIFTCGYSPTTLNNSFDLRTGENFLPKPFGMVELLNIVGKALQLSSLKIRNSICG